MLYLPEATPGKNNCFTTTTTANRPKDYYNASSYSLEEVFIHASSKPTRTFNHLCQPTHGNLCAMSSRYCLSEVDGVVLYPRSHSREEPTKHRKAARHNSLGNESLLQAKQKSVRERENIGKLSKSLPILTSFEIGLHKVSRIHRDRQPSAVSVDAACGRG